jgi:hypothetical protein
MVKKINNKNSLVGDNNQIYKGTFEWCTVNLSSKAQGQDSKFLVMKLGTRIEIKFAFHDSFLDPRLKKVNHINRKKQKALITVNGTVCAVFSCYARRTIL